MSFSADWVRVVAIASFCLLQVSAIAQLPLNLSFEELSVEGLARPWGWQVNAYASDANFACDTSTVFSGRHSLRIAKTEASSETPFELAFFVEPSQLLGNKVELSGFVLAKRASGEYGIKIQTIGSTESGYDILDEQIAFASDKGKEKWENLSLSIEIETRAHSLLIILLHAGTGTVWFDSLALQIEGETLNEVPVAPSFSKGQQQQIKKQITELQTVDPSRDVKPTHDHFSDLDFLRREIGHARLIALGESTHGTSEFFRMKHRLIQCGIHQLGVRTLILEDNQLVVERLNQYLVNGKSDARTAMKGLFAVWGTIEMLELIEWMRSYNLLHPNDPVEIKGMDVQNPSLAFDSLSQFLSEVDPELSVVADSLLNDYRSNWTSGFFVGDSVLTSWLDKVERFCRIIEERQSRWRTTSNSNRREWAIQNSRVLAQHLRSVLSGGFAGRDSAMAENVNWILSRMPPDTKAMIWAHDSHIARGDAEDPEANYFLGTSMGSLLSKKYGNDYLALCLFTHRGKCRGTVSYADHSYVEFDLFPAPMGSVEQGLHLSSQLLKSPILYLDLRKFRKEQKKTTWIRERRPVRYVGYVAEDYGFGGRYSIPHQFDGIFFIDQTSAAKGM